MNKRYPDEMEAFVREMAKAYVPVEEMARRCVERFNLDRPISRAAMQSYKTDRGIVNPPRYSAEFLDAVRELVADHSLQETAAILSERFNREVTFYMLKGIMARNGIKTGRTGLFEPGHSYGKGRTMSAETREKLKGTFFKKGQRSQNWVPAGTEVFRDGYMLVKVKDGPDLGQWDRWAFKHRLVWEAAHGPIPKGGHVIFLDGDHRNCELSNLALVNNAEQGYLTMRGLRSSNAEITRVGVTVARLGIAIKNKRKKGAPKCAK